MSTLFPNQITATPCSLEVTSSDALPSSPSRRFPVHQHSSSISLPPPSHHTRSPLTTPPRTLGGRGPSSVPGRRTASMHEVTIDMSPSLAPPSPDPRPWSTLIASSVDVNALCDAGYDFAFVTSLEDIAAKNDAGLSHAIAPAKLLSFYRSCADMLKREDQHHKTPFRRSAMRSGLAELARATVMRLFHVLVSTTKPSPNKQTALQDVISLSRRCELVVTTDLLSVVVNDIFYRVTFCADKPHAVFSPALFQSQIRDKCSRVILNLAKDDAARDYIVQRNLFWDILSATEWHLNLSSPRKRDALTASRMLEVLALISSPKKYHKMLAKQYQDLSTASNMVGYDDPSIITRRVMRRALRRGDPCCAINALRLLRNTLDILAPVLVPAVSPDIVQAADLHPDILPEVSALVIAMGKTEHQKGFHPLSLVFWTRVWGACRHGHRSRPLLSTGSMLAAVRMSGIVPVLLRHLFDAKDKHKSAAATTLAALAHPVLCPESCRENRAEIQRLLSQAMREDRVPGIFRAIMGASDLSTGSIRLIIQTIEEHNDEREEAVEKLRYLSCASFGDV